MWVRWKNPAMFAEEGVHGGCTFSRVMRINIRYGAWLMSVRYIYKTIIKSPDFHIHVSVSDLYISRIDLPILLEPNRQGILGIYELLKDT